MLFVLGSCKEVKVQLTHGTDESAGGGPAYIINTPSAIYYLEKEGGGLSSMIDVDGVDWIGFHNEKGSGHKGEYRGFPNAIHKQDGSYFHAMNAGTDPSSSVVEIETKEHVRITFTSENGEWQGQWDFYPARCDFTMTKISAGYNYWVQYEGVPNGEMDSTDYWYASIDTKKHPIEEPFVGDLPAPEWMAFGDQNSSRVLYMLHHEDDELPDNYVSRPDMTVLGFGRQNGEKTTKHLNMVQTFSIGFIESSDYSIINRAIKQGLD
ncbi:hypothetical protein JQC67_06480 [Aurantibacter crassamenti]|uniref:hypothetical protein n=1 Tax=Aurantibacter crassamenti TaxID=1837375 RepID=UPI00193AD740|nr:hypothetical protein [Aurantibacter crassamenti]MBM1105774.1 hypothetical protein [Aurantibacter crassamenti]